MQKIIDPIDRVKIKTELLEEKLLRKTNKGNNEIYIVNAHNSPETMKEIGRLREVSFRAAGGGTGKEMDIDNYDTMNRPYDQLIVWNPEDEEIVGGYRFYNCSWLNLQKNKQPELATTKLFYFSGEFIQTYLPYTIELGRSFVQPSYQPSVDSRKGIYSLDNLWDGLGALTIRYPNTRFYFGKITMYPKFNQTARDLILFFIKKHFPDDDALVTPHRPVLFKTKLSILEEILSGDSFADDYPRLVKSVRNFDENVPPLVNAYMNLSSTMRYFGTAINDTFGEVEETGIIISIDDIYPQKKERHVNTYLNN